MSLCYVGRHSYFCNANMPILFPICQYNDINIIAEHCICQLPLSETLVRDERKIGSRDIVFVFVKQLTCHSSRRLGQTVPSSGSEPGCRPAGKVSHEFYINLNPESRPGWPRWWPPIIASYTATWRRPSAPPSPPRSSRSPSLSWGSGEDFKNMNALDRYDKLLRSGGLVTKSS